MPRRLPKYPIKPHVMAPDVEIRFKKLIGKKKKKGKELKPDRGWQLWEWNSLKDRPDLNE